MDAFLKIAAYIFHPLWVATIGVGLYFWVTPRYLTSDMVWSKMVVVFILTFLIPVLFYFLLKALNLISSVYVENVKERRIPLVLQFGLFFLIIKIVFEPYFYPELHYFFVAGLYSTLTALILVLFSFKVSLHMMGVAALSMFLIALSIHFKINTLGLIAISFFIVGWVASSRLYTKSHTPIELIFGFVVGFIPQLILVNFWL